MLSWWTLRQLKSKKSRKRKKAVFKLHGINDKQAVELLIEMLDDKDDAVQEAAAYGLGSIVEGDAWAWDLVKKIVEGRAVEPLLKLAKKGVRARRAAAWTLGEIGNKKSIKALIPLLTDAVAREAAAMALNKIEPGWNTLNEAKAAVPDLLEMLEDSDDIVREASLEALVLIPDKRAAGSLRKIIKSEEGRMQEIAQTALANVDALDSWVWKGHEKLVSSMAFLPGGQRLVSSSYDGTMILWDLQKHSPKKSWAFSYGVLEVDVSPDGAVLGAACLDKSYDVWNLPNGQKRTIIEANLFANSSVAFSPDGKYYAVGSLTGYVDLMPTATYKTNCLKEGEEQVIDVTFSPDSTCLATSFADKSIIIWNICKNELLSELEIDRIGEIAIVGSTPQLVIGTVFLGEESEREWPDGVQVRDFETGTVLREIEGARGPVSASRDGKLLACCGLEGGIQIGDTDNWRKIASFQVPNGPPICVAISNEQDKIACGTVKGYISVFPILQS